MRRPGQLLLTGPIWLSALIAGYSMLEAER
jgi:hypothetical protein